MILVQGIPGLQAQNAGGGQQQNVVMVQPNNLTSVTSSPVSASNGNLFKTNLYSFFDELEKHIFFFKFSI